MKTSKKIELAKRALMALDPNTIKNRAMGKCKLCGEPMGNSTDMWCKPCAVGIIEDALDSAAEDVFRLEDLDR